MDAHINLSTQSIDILLYYDVCLRKLAFKKGKKNLCIDWAQIKMGPNNLNLFLF